MRPGTRSLAYIGLAVAAICLIELAAEPREAEAQRAGSPDITAAPQPTDTVEPVDVVEMNPACVGAVWPYVDPSCLDSDDADRPVARVLRADGDLESRRAAELRRLAGGR